MATIDWDHWRKKFIQGPDTLTIKGLSEYNGAPAYQTLRNRSSKEDWVAQRRRFRDNVGTLADTVPDAQQVASKVEKVIDAAEMMTRHMQAFRLAGSKAIAKLNTVKPESLTVKEALDLLKWAVDGERLTEGLATQRQEIDLSGMSEADLEKLAKG